MHVWRLILVLLLSVAVSSHGLAAVGRHNDCPALAHVAGAGQLAASDSCCGDMGGHKREANDACQKLCGIGGTCGGAGLVHTSVDPEPGVTTRARMSLGAFVHIAAVDPSGVWRPPRSL